MTIISTAKLARTDQKLIYTLKDINHEQNSLKRKITSQKGELPEEVKKVQIISLDNTEGEALSSKVFTGSKKISLVTKKILEQWKELSANLRLLHEKPQKNRGKQEDDTAQRRARRLLTYFIREIDRKKIEYKQELGWKTGKKGSTDFSALNGAYAKYKEIDNQLNPFKKWAEGIKFPSEGMKTLEKVKRVERLFYEYIDQVEAMLPTLKHTMVEAGITAGIIKQK